jgi:hypothetical protein
MTVAAVAQSLASDPEWLRRIASATTGPRGVHLAVCLEPFLGYILSGRKTIESRFGVTRAAPYGRVRCGDFVLLKQASGPVVGLCDIGEVWSCQIQSQDDMEAIRREFSTPLCATDPEFWNQRQAAHYVTLMRVRNVRSVHPVPFAKRDRRGWVVLKPSGQPPLLPG